MANTVDAVWPAPGKINRFLHITGRREDGYHELQTLFQFIDLCDELSFSPRSDGAIHLTSDLAGVAARDNLVVRAAELLQEHAGSSRGADIALRKQLPIGGGVGGGSSDAATTLHALNQLWRLGLETPELQQLAVKLGADVPIFVAGVAAFAQGIGERLYPLETNEQVVLLVDPGVSVNTAIMYADPELRRDCLPVMPADLDLSRTENVFERVVLERFPEVREAHAWLSSRCPTRLSGSGACLFGEFDTLAAARTVHARLPAQWRGWVTQSRNRSPLLARIEAAHD